MKKTTAIGSTTRLHVELPASTIDDRSGYREGPKIENQVVGSAMGRTPKDTDARLKKLRLERSGGRAQAERALLDTPDANSGRRSPSGTPPGSLKVRRRIALSPFSNGRVDELGS